MFKAHAVERRYLALVRGTVEHRDFSVDAPLGRRADRVVVDHTEGRAAETAFEVRERLGNATLLEATPRTGRTHQIRVHLQAIGHPDPGRPGATGAAATTRRRSGLTRPFLHSWRIDVRPPHDRGADRPRGAAAR